MVGPVPFAWSESRRARRKGAPLTFRRTLRLLRLVLHARFHDAVDFRDGLVPGCRMLFWESRADRHGLTGLSSHHVHDAGEKAAQSRGRDVLVTSMS